MVTIMIILNIKINNIYNFTNFEMNLSYPRKIENSTIENENLLGYPNFRYKKAVILMGANATGKTCLGRTIKNVCDFLNYGNLASITSMVNNPLLPATISLEIVNNDNYLKEIIITCVSDKIIVKINKAAISEKDSYEMAHKKLFNVYDGTYTKEVNDIIGYLNCQFAYPEIEKSLKTNSVNNDIFLKTLKCVIGTLDPTLKNVIVSHDLKNSFIIKRGNSEIIIQDGKLLNRELLSSGTVEGIDVALFLAMMENKEKSFYYCDEHFSYIQSDIEKKIFQIMLGKLKDNEQLFFTTHNTDMLDLNLPKHTFALLRRNENNNTEVVFVSSLLKRNTDSVKCAVENDAFNSMPNLSLLDTLEECDDK